MKLRDAGEYLLCMVFPERCIFCNEVIEPLHLACDACMADMHLILPPSCPYCGCHEQDCRCAEHRHCYDNVVAPFYYKGAVRSGILRLKKWDDPRAVDYFAAQMTAAIRREYPDIPFEAVFYVPMTKGDQRERGYNQSQLLAREVAKRLGLPLQHHLIKLYQTAPQKQLKLWQRKGNVLGAFGVTQLLEESHVLLVDDLLTTGASMDECAKMLKLYGVTTVTALTAALTPPDKGDE